MAIYGSRFQNQNDDEAILLWVETWALGLSGISGEQLKFGLEAAGRDSTGFAPTLGAFRSWCQSMPRPVIPPERRIPLKTGVTEHAEDRLAKTRELMAKPKKPPGRWCWHEVIAKIERGEHVTIAAERLAREAISHEM